MFYKMFVFFLNISKTVKLSFTGYFSEVLLAYFKFSKTLCTLLLLKVYKTFKTCLLACFALKVYKTFLKYHALKVYNFFYKHGSLGSTTCFIIKTGVWAQPFALK